LLPSFERVEIVDTYHDPIDPGLSYTEKSRQSIRDGAVEENRELLGNWIHGGKEDEVKIVHLLGKWVSRIRGWIKVGPNVTQHGLFVLSERGWNRKDEKDVTCMLGILTGHDHYEVV
jgi:hypothetical protein